MKDLALIFEHPVLEMLLESANPNEIRDRDNESRPRFGLGRSPTLGLVVVPAAKRPFPAAREQMAK